MIRRAIDIALAPLRRAWRCIAGDGLKPALCRIVVFVCAVILGAVLAAASGLVQIAASEGHWPLVEHFLEFTMRRSVRTQTLTIDAPPLDDPGDVLKGARHYVSACLPCHGAPGREPSLIVAQMVPAPPDFRRERPDFAAEQMYWIIKHGLKYTAMPGWPSQQRDDEVWSMVAFMQVLPELDVAGFAALAYGEATAAAQDIPQGGWALSMPVSWNDIVAGCARCHGRDGEGHPSGAFPALAGQSATYLRHALYAYADGARHSGVMQPLAVLLPPEDIDRIAAHYADMPAPPAADAPSASDTSDSLGRRIALRGVPEERVPACVGCHGPPARDRNPAYPRIAGQHEAYLRLQLELFRAGHRGGGPYADIMRQAAQPLTDEQIRAVARYYAQAR